MIKVEDYNESWPKWFASLHSKIWPVVREVALAIEHVGSTSAPGLAVKQLWAHLMDRPTLNLQNTFSWETKATTMTSQMACPKISSKSLNLTSS